MAKTVNVIAGNETIQGDLNMAPNSPAIVVFAHVSGSSRQSESFWRTTVCFFRIAPTRGAY